MNQVKTYSSKNWEFDQLDCVELVDGESIYVRWPDGTTTLEIVRIEKQILESFYMERHEFAPVKKAFIYTEFRGVPCRCYLAQALIMCERVKS